VRENLDGMAFLIVENSLVQLLESQKCRKGMWVLKFNLSTSSLSFWKWLKVRDLENPQARRSFRFKPRVCAHFIAFTFNFHKQPQGFGYFKHTGTLYFVLSIDRALLCTKTNMAAQAIDALANLKGI
jgi:hypothetical protein